jgi:hypothetical protein
MKTLQKLLWLRLVFYDSLTITILLEYWYFFTVIDACFTLKGFNY